MKFFDRFFGRDSSDDQTPEKKEDQAPAAQEPKKEAAPVRDLRDQEHIAKALSVVLSLHNEKKTEETLMSVLRCLMENPPVWVPLRNGVPDTTQADSGEHYLPIFTSMDQVADSYEQVCQWQQLRFLELKPHVTRESRISGILINGFSHDFILHRMTFPMFFDQTKPQAGVVPHNLAEHKTFLLSPAGKEAEQLKDAAIKFLASHNCQKAYFGKLNNNGEESYLFAIEQNVCPDSEFFKLMHQELSGIPAPLPIDYTSYAGFRKHITPDNCQMIYQQDTGATG